jgi:histidine triad (HIT) family protein
MICDLCQIKNIQKFCIVHQDAFVVISVNIEPLKPGHVMVMPTRHAEQLGDLHNEEASGFLKGIDRAIASLKKFSDEEPMCVVNGPRYRTQSHLHAHVLPCKKNGLRDLYAAAEGLPERQRADQKTLTEMADQLRPFFE